MSTPDVESFDQWYRSIAASPRFDPFVQQWLGLPADVPSTGYLSGAGLAEVVDALGLERGSTLVELGCGRGGYGLAAVRGTGARLVGVDFSAVAVAQARQHAVRLRLDDVAEFAVGDLAASGLAAGSADAVLCVDAFHFARSTAAASAECRRLLRAGGRLVMTSWEPAEPGSGLLPARLRDADVRRDLPAAGFVDVLVHPRPDWAALERRLWEAATALEPAGDEAVTDLVEEAGEMLPLAPLLRRVLVTARTPSTTST